MGITAVFEKASPFLIGIGMPLAMVTLPMVYFQGKDIARLEVHVSSIKDDTSNLTESQVATAASLKSLELQLTRKGYPARRFGHQR